MNVKSALLSLAIALAATTASAGDVTLRLTVRTDSISKNARDGSVTFMCRAVVNNQTGGALTANNLFQDHSGLALKVSDDKGNELARLYAAPFHRSAFEIPEGEMTFSPYYGIMNRFAPGTNTTVQLQLEGQLPGSNYTNKLTSNVVEMNLPQ